MNTPIMPKATAVWLIENTSLTFTQIAEFCDMHPLEIQALADGQISVGLIGIDPIASGQVTKEEIQRCQKDTSAKIQLNQRYDIGKKKKQRKYTPLIKRHEKPDAIAWILKNYPEIPESEICSFLSTTKNTILAIKNKTHARMSSIKPRDPVLLGFCSQLELDSFTSKFTKESTLIETR